MHTKNAALACALGIAGTVSAQTWEPNGAVMRFEVWNGTAWTSGPIAAMPGDRIEWRTVVSYVGTRTDLLALGGALHQPTISNTDNTGPIRDELAPWRNNGITAHHMPGTILTAAEGVSAAPNPLGYGRVSFYSPAMQPEFSNTMTTFRHSAGSNGAPAGNWIRMAGSFGTLWPRSLDGTTGTADDFNRILRGVGTTQQPRDLLPEPYVEGVSNLVVFRQALVLGDSTDLRTIQVSTFQESFRRWGVGSSTDDRRFFYWQASYSDTGLSGHRTGVAIEPAFIVVVPTPQTALVLLLAGSPVVRRRRVGSPMLR